MREEWGQTGQRLMMSLTLGSVELLIKSKADLNDSHSGQFRVQITLKE